MTTRSLQMMYCFSQNVSLLHMMTGHSICMDRSFGALSGRLYRRWIRNQLIAKMLNWKSECLFEAIS